MAIKFKFLVELMRWGRDWIFKADQQMKALKGDRDTWKRRALDAEKLIDDYLAARDEREDLEYD